MTKHHYKTRTNVELSLEVRVCGFTSFSKN